MQVKREVQITNTNKRTNVKRLTPYLVRLAATELCSQIQILMQTRIKIQVQIQILMQKYKSQMQIKEQITTGMDRAAPYLVRLA